MRFSRIDTSWPQCWRSPQQDQYCTASAWRRQYPKSSQVHCKSLSCSSHHQGRFFARSRMSGCLHSSSLGLSLSLVAVASKVLSAQLVREYNKLDLVWSLHNLTRLKGSTKHISLSDFQVDVTQLTYVINCAKVALYILPKVAQDWTIPGS